jgi:choloylglycine hydrolase
MCTNFLLAVPSHPGNASGATTYVTARCIELPGTLPTSLYLIPRGQHFPLVPPPPPVLHPKKWTNPYGFVGLADSQAFATFPCFMDGLNEEGLSLGALWLAGAVYPSSGRKPNLFFSDLCAWVLGSFATVAELEEGLDTISVVGPPIPAAGEPSCYQALHFIATDATGASLVVEFVGGEMKVYPPSYQNDATADGVLTNAPPYDWQRANLANYTHLSVVGSVTSATDPSGPPVGSGLVGMPGDPMSASRFVRAATLQKGWSRLPADGAGWLPAPGGAEGGAGPVQTAVCVALEMVRGIQATPYGTALTSSTPTAPPQPGDWTMWSVVRDHTHRVLYFMTAFNGILRAIDLKALSFTGGPRSPGSYPSLALQPAPASFAWYVDVTKQLS